MRGGGEGMIGRDEEVNGRKGKKEKRVRERERERTPMKEREREKAENMKGTKGGS